MPNSNFVQRFRWAGLIFIGISVLVISLDNTVLNVALPSIAVALGTNTNDLQWVVDSYTLVFAALLLTSGAVGDRFGRKRVLQIGLIWFIADSLLTATATSTATLIASRALLGLGGAFILPATLSIVTATFSSKERPQAIAIWAAIFGLGVGLGPVIGGLLLEHFNWNAVFLINLPTCLIALIGGAIFLGESKDDAPPPFDILGVILSIVGLFALTYGIISAGVHGWADPGVIGGLLIGVVLLALFALWEYRTPNAMLPMRFFRNRSFSIASLTLAFTLFNQFAYPFLMTPYLQTVRGYSTLQAGLRVAPFAFMLMGMAVLSPRVIRRLGVKRSVGFGVGLSALSLFYIAAILRTDTPYVLIFAGQIVFGFGVGLTFSPATNSIMGAVPIRRAGIGSAMNDTTRQLGGAFGVAIVGTVLNLTYIGLILQAKITPALAAIPARLFGEISNSVQAAHTVAAQLPAALSQAVLITADQAYTRGMSNAFFVGAAVMVVSDILVWAFLPAVPQRIADADLDQRDQPADRTEISGLNPIESHPLPTSAGD